MPTLQQAIYKTFHGAFSDVRDQTPEKESVPKVNIIETDSAYFIEMALPGYQKMNLMVKLEHDVLEVSGGAVTRPYRNVVRMLKTDFDPKGFSRSFILPDKVKELVAWYDAGVLYVQLLKSNDPSILKDREVVIQ